MLREFKLLGEMTVFLKGDEVQTPTVGLEAGDQDDVHQGMHPLDDRYEISFNQNCYNHKSQVSSTSSYISIE